MLAGFAEYNRPVKPGNPLSRQRILENPRGCPSGWWWVTGQYLRADRASFIAPAGVGFYIAKHAPRVSLSGRNALQDKGMQNLIVFRSGTAAVTAGLHAGRAAFAPPVVAGSEPGAQSSTTGQIEGQPGFLRALLVLHS